VSIITQKNAVFSSQNHLFSIIFQSASNQVSFKFQSDFNQNRKIKTATDCSIAA
jgi:hypothetical protein